MPIIDNINHNFKSSEKLHQENTKSYSKEKSARNKKRISDNSKNVESIASKKSNFSIENINELECLKNSADALDDNFEDYSFNKGKIIKEFENDISFNSNDLVKEDEDYIKEMKELYKLFKKNLLKIKFEKFPNNELCNKNNLKIKIQDKNIFKNLIKENIPEEEWYDFIYEEILNYNCIQTVQSIDTEKNLK